MTIKMSFPKATIMIRQKQTFYEIQTRGDSEIFFAFSSFEKAAIFCQDNNKNISLSPIKIDQIDQFKEEFRHYSCSPEDKDNLIAINPESFRPSKIIAVKLKDLLEIDSDEIEVNEYNLEWAPNGSVVVKDSVYK